MKKNANQHHLLSPVEVDSVSFSLSLFPSLNGMSIVTLPPSLLPFLLPSLLPSQGLLPSLSFLLSLSPLSQTPFSLVSLSLFVSLCLLSLFHSLFVCQAPSRVFSLPSSLLQVPFLLLTLPSFLPPTHSPTCANADSIFR